jgi:hypothetical protein
MKLSLLVKAIPMLAAALLASLAIFADVRRTENCSHSALWKNFE